MNKIKQLAEQHFFEGRRLTKKEIRLLEKTEFKDLIDYSGNSDTKFDRVFEQASIGEMDEDDRPEFKPKTYKAFRMGTVCVDKRAIAELVNDIEKDFDLGIHNGDPGKYEALDLAVLKQYVGKYSDKNVFDEDTKHMIDKVLDAEDVYDVMLSLYSIR